MRALSSTEKKYLADCKIHDLNLVALLVISQVFFYYGVKYIMNQVNPMSARRKESQEKSRRALGRLGATNMKLNQYEEIIATELVFPEEMGVDFKSMSFVIYILV